MGFEPFIHFMREMHGKLNASIFGGAQGMSSQQIAYLRQLQRELDVERSLNVPLCELDVVVLDLETTGFFPDKGDEILSIGAVKVEKGEMIEEKSFYSLVQYEGTLKKEVKEITGINEGMVKNAPSLSHVLIDFFSFAGDMPIVAHHANHEKNFLQHASWKLFRAPLKHRIIDTSFLYRIADEKDDNKPLEEWCLDNNIIVENRHHALGDAKLTAKLWCTYVKKVQKSGCETLRDIYERIAAK